MSQSAFGLDSGGTDGSDSVLSPNLYLFCQRALGGASGGASAVLGERAGAASGTLGGDDAVFAAAFLFLASCNAAQIASRYSRSSVYPRYLTHDLKK